MKVLTFTTSLSLKSGGPSRSVPMMVKGLAEIGVDVTLMTVWSDDMNTHALDGSSAKIKILQPNYSQKEVEEYIVSERFDLIQVQSMWNLQYHRLKRLADKYSIPYVITPRGMLEPWSLNQKKWKKKLALWVYQMKDLKTSACVFTTAEMEAEHVRDLGIKVPISVIPNGIEIKGYECRSTIKTVKKQVLFLSRIHKKKGIELLIDAWQKLKPDFPEWNLVIAGNGEEEYIDSLKKKVVDCHLQDCISILPPVFGEGKYKLYCESALFVLPSYSENFGMVIAEAMSCGVPSITTTNTPWELLNGEKSTMGAQISGRTGWCIDLSIEQLEYTLRSAMNMNFEELYDMGQLGSQMIAENFDYKSVARKVVALYNWIIKKEEKPNFVYLK